MPNSEPQRRIFAFVPSYALLMLLLFSRCWSQEVPVIPPPLPVIPPSLKEPSVAHSPGYKRPVALNNPTPHYTEEARKNKIQGIVIARALVGVDGAVKQVRIVRGLPDGLDEQAIQAAYRIRFRPAVRGGRPVAEWTTVRINFGFPPRGRAGEKASLEKVVWFVGLRKFRIYEYSPLPAKHAELSKNRQPLGLSPSFYWRGKIPECGF